MADCPARSTRFARYEFRTHAPLPRLPVFRTPSVSSSVRSSPLWLWWTRCSPLVADTLIPSPCLRLFNPSFPSLSTPGYPSRKTNSRPFFCSVARIYIFRASTPRRRVFHAAKKALGGNSRGGRLVCFLDTLRPRPCVGGWPGWMGGCIRGWLERVAAQQEEGGARWWSVAWVRWM